MTLAIGQPLRWLGGQIDVRVEAGLTIEPDGALWDIGEWDNNAWASVDGLYTDITDKVLGVVVDRGRSRFAGRFEAGQLTVVLDNTDGRFSPGSGVSEYDYEFRPGRPIRVVAYPHPDEETGRTLITARIADSRDIALEGGFDITANVVASDALADLAAINPPAGSATGVQRTDERINSALDNVGWPIDLRAVQLGAHTMQTSDLAQTALEEIMRAGDAEGGLVYADEGNRIVFKNRDWLVGGIQPSLEPFAAAVIASDPVAYWRMTGAATDDSSTAGTHALTWSGGPTTGVAGVTADDEAVSTDGVNDVATVANEGDIELAQDMTVEFWFRPHDDAGADQTIISCRASGDPLYEIIWDPAAQVLQFFPSIDAASGVTISPVLADNEWHHVAVIVQWFLSSRNIIGVVNGESAGVHNVAYLPSPAAPVVNIARRAIGNDLHFDGDISELAVYDRLLSLDEIQNHFDASTAPNERATTIQGYIGYDTAVPDPSVPAAEPVDVQWSYELARVENDIQLARVGGTAQTAEDLDSQARHGRRTFQFFDLQNNADDEVQTLADRRLAANRTLRRRIESVTLAANDDPADAGLNRLLYDTRIGDLWSVLVATGHGWSFEGLGHVMGIHHEIDGSDWRATFTLDDSLIGVQ